MAHPSIVTIDNLESAIRTTAKAMVAHHDLAPKILPRLKRLQEARDDLLKAEDPVETAKRILAA